MSELSPGDDAATRKAMKRLQVGSRVRIAGGTMLNASLRWRAEFRPEPGQVVARTCAFFGPAAAHPASYFLPVVVVAVWTWPCLSCLDFAWVAALVLATFFWFWLRCFDLGDLSLMVAPFDGEGHLREDRSLLIVGQAVKIS